MSGIEYSNDSYCAICDLYFPSVKDRAEHVADSPTHPRCDTCARRFLNGNILRNHYVYSRFHHYCAACRVSFSTAAGLRMHVEHSAVHGDDSDDDDDEGPSSSSSVILVEGQEDYLGGLTYPDESSDDEEYGDEYSDGDDSWEHFDECDFEDEEDFGDVVRYDTVDVGVTEEEEEEEDDDDEVRGDGVSADTFACPICDLRPALSVPRRAVISSVHRAYGRRMTFRGGVRNVMRVDM